MFENSITPDKPVRRPVPKDAYADDIAKQHNYYTKDTSTLWGKERVYYADYQQKSEVIRAQDSRLTTKLDDRHTVSAMLDLAEQRGWERLKLSGTASFRREAWVQAQVRGIEVSGYRPKETDTQEAARRLAAAKPVSAPAQKAKEATPKPAAKAKPKAPAQTQRAAEKAAWNVVETSGKVARERDAAKPEQRPRESENPAPAASEAA